MWLLTKLLVTAASSKRVMENRRSKLDSIGSKDVPKHFVNVVKNWTFEGPTLSQWNFGK